MVDITTKATEKYGLELNSKGKAEDCQADALNEPTKSQTRCCELFNIIVNPVRERCILQKLSLLQMILTLLNM